MTKSINLRSLSAQLIERVVDKGESLNTALPAAQKKLSDKDSAKFLVDNFRHAVRYPNGN